MSPRQIAVRLAVVGLIGTGVSGLAACNTLDYGCSRQGSHGAVVCINTNHNPSAAKAINGPDTGHAVLARGSSWS